jgi:Synergist-CTERM protein sorting domain-containing protein
MLKRKSVVVLLAIAALAVFAAGASAATQVTDETELFNAFANGGEYELANDIDVTTYSRTNPIKTGDGVNVVLDLKGHKINNSNPRTLHVAGAGTLTINDSVGTGSIEGGSTIYIKGDIREDSDTPIKSTCTLNGGTIKTKDYWGVIIYGNGATFNMNGGKITLEKEESICISGNGLPKNAGTEINIAGGLIDAFSTARSIGIYHPQKGVLNISGGYIRGDHGVQFKAGELNITGGKIEAFAKKPENLEANNNGAVETGAAVSFVSNKNYGGEMKLNISGNPELISHGSYAVWEDTTVGEESQTISVNIAGGEFSGLIDGEANAMYFKNWENIEDKNVTGGTFNSDPTPYMTNAANSELVNKDGVYVLKTKAATGSGGGGGGCSTGFASLALLALAAPMLYRRKR